MRRFKLFLLSCCLATITARADVYTALAFDNQVRVFADDAAENDPPLRVIEGPATLLNAPAGVAIDLAADELFVSNVGDDSVLVYPLDADGDTAPLRVLAGSETGFRSPIGMIVDSINDELYVFDRLGRDVKVFPRDASGNVGPLRSIGGPNLNLIFPRFGFLDLTADELYVLDQGSGVETVYVFHRTASGDARPLRSITGDNTEMSEPADLFLNRNAEELYVLQNDSRAVTVYEARAEGNVAPLRTIVGPATGLLNPASLLVTEDDQLIVTNRDFGYRIFPAGASGDVSPIVTINQGKGSAIASTRALEGSAGFAVIEQLLFTSSFETLGDR
ncbi:MAG: hypothetical protein AAF358_24465 [Pseudomonadota bacterium]